MAKVEQATEVVAEVAEEVADQAEVVAEVARGLSGRDIRLVLAGAGVGLVGGFIIGGLVIQKRLRTSYERVAEEEIQQMREHFRAKELAREEKPDLQEFKDKIKEEGYESTSKVEEGGETLAVLPEKEEAAPVDEAPEVVEGDVVEVQTHNVFEDHETVPEFDYERELATRTSDKPYVIHKDEVGEKEFPEATLTYYEKDDVVCDAEDKIVDNLDQVLGDFASKFGYGSDDADVVYIRNEDLMTDYEVCRSRNSYTEEVHGLTHSEPTSRRHERNRFDDD